MEQIYDSDFGTLTRAKAKKHGLESLFDQVADEWRSIKPCTCGTLYRECPTCGHEEYVGHHKDCPQEAPRPMAERLDAELEKLYRSGVAI